MQTCRLEEDEREDILCQRPLGSFVWLAGEETEEIGDPLDLTVRSRLIRRGRPGSEQREERSYDGSPGLARGFRLDRPPDRGVLLGSGSISLEVVDET